MSLQRSGHGEEDTENCGVPPPETVKKQEVEL